MNLIEKLKDKTYVRAFGLMTPEEQKCFREVGSKNRLVLLHTGWEEDTGYIGEQQQRGPSFSYTYAIKPDYQPELEHVDVKITRDGGYLCVYREDLIITKENCLLSFIPVGHLTSLPNFHGFYLMDHDKVEVQPAWVARYYPNVIARFRA